MTDQKNDGEASRLWWRLVELAMVAWVLVVHIFFARQYLIHHWDAILALIWRFVG